jgi:hypothetical protein
MHGHLIPQELLLKYQRLSSREKIIRARKEKLRTKLLGLWKTGARAAPGKLGVRVTTQECIRLSWSKVEEVLDDGTVDLLRDEIPPTQSTYLFVFERPAKSKSVTQNGTASKNW